MAKQQDKRKVILIVAILVVVLVSSMVFAAPSGGGPGGPGGGNMGQIEMSESVINVKLATPTRGDISRDTEFIGKIEPSETVNVFPEISEKVTKIYVEAGDTVQAGDLLFEMDDSDAQLSYEKAQVQYEGTQINNDTTLGSNYEQQLISAENSLKNAQQQMTSARQELQEYNDDSEDELIQAEKLRDRAYDAYITAEKAYDEDPSEENKQKLEEAEEKYLMYRDAVNELEDTDDSQLRSLRNAYKSAQTSYDTALESYNLLKGGSLDDTKASVENSQKSAELTLEESARTLEKYKVYAPISGTVESKNITLYESPSTQTAAYTISNKAQMTVKFNATADAASALSIGDTITITKSGNEYTATIIEIDTKADDTTGLFPIKAQIGDEGEGLLNGVTVKVTAATAKAENALLIDVDNIYYEDGQAYVFTYSDGKAHRTDIQVGMTNAETAVVESGLDENSQIITTWHPDLKDGASVNLMDETSAQDSAADTAEGTVPEGTPVTEGEEQSEQLPEENSSQPAQEAQAQDNNGEASGQEPDQQPGQEG